MPGTSAEETAAPRTAVNVDAVGCANTLSAAERARLEHAVSACTDGMKALAADADAVAAAKARLLQRKEASIAKVRVDVEQVKAALDSHVERVVADTVAKCKHSAKMLDAQVDELVVSAGQLSCVSALCTAVLRGDCRTVSSDAALASVSHAMRTVKPYRGPWSSTLVEAVSAFENLTTWLESSIRVRDTLCDDKRTFQSGDGKMGPRRLVLNSLEGGLDLAIKLHDAVGPVPAVTSRITLEDAVVWGDVITVPLHASGRRAQADSALTAAGGGADVVKPPPITWSVRTGDVHAGPEDGVIRVGQLHCSDEQLLVPLSAEAVDADVINRDSVKVQLFANVCGVTLRCFPIMVSGERGGLSTFHGLGEYVTSIKLESVESYGMAVSVDEDLLAAVEYAKHRIALYELPGGRFLRHIGGHGSSPGQLNDPIKVIFSPEGTLLVADKLNNQVQELTVYGEMVRSFSAKQARCIALSPDCSHMAVGLSAGPKNVVILAYDTGEQLLEFVSMSPSETHVGQCEGLRYTADGMQIITVSSTSKRVNMFSSIDGTFQRSFAMELVGSGLQIDVDWTVDGNIICAATHQKKLHIVSFTDDKVLHSWDAREVPGSTKSTVFLTAMSIVNGRLYIVNNNTHAVDVYL